MVFARRRTTGIRPVLPWAPVRIAACAVAVAVTAPCPVQPAAQDTAAGRDATSAWLAAYPPEPAFICGSPALAARQMIRGAGLNPMRNCTSDCRSSRSTSPCRESGRSTQTSSTPATS